MSLKVVVVLSMMAMASASPTPTGGLLPLPTIDLGKILNLRLSDLGKNLGSLFRTIIGSKHIARKNHDTVMNMKINNWEDVCDLTTKIVVSLCDTVEGSFKGLGVLLSRVIFCLLRIIVCFQGKGGSNNPLCNDNINTLVGIPATKVLDIKALIKLYGLEDCHDQIQIIINIYTKGLGISRCKRSTGVIFRITVELVKVLQIVISGGSLTKDHLTLCFTKISIIIGALGNSRKSGLGLSIVKNYIPTCNKHLKIAGYKEIVISKDDRSDLDDCDDDNGPWAVSEVDTSVDTGASVSVCGLIGGLFKGLIGIERLVKDLVKTILKIVIKSIDDVFTLVIRIILGLGGLLDATCSGLGSLFARMCGALLKIHLCFLGNKLSIQSVKSEVDKYGVCKPGWDSIFGVSGSVTSIDLAINLYGVGKCRSQVDVYISAYVKIYGRETGSVKILFDACRTISSICDGRKWDKSIVITVIKQVTYCLGAVGNSNSKGVGTAICNKFIPTCNKYLVDAGYTGLIEDQQNAVVIVDSCNEDRHTWCSDIDTSDGKSGWIAVDVGVSGGGGGVSIGVILKGIFASIRGVTKLAAGALDAILKCTINTLDDVFELIVNLILVLEVTLNNLVVGLGTLCVRIVACIIKIAVCVKKCPGDRGICTPAWNRRFRIEGDASTGAEMIKIFKLTQVQDHYNGYVKSCTKGRGISSLPRNSVRIVLEKFAFIVKIIINFESITKNTVTDLFLHLISISVCIGNSQKKDSGRQITQVVVPKCGKRFIEGGYTDITVNITIIETECKPANNDDCDWNGGDNNTTPSPGGGTTPSHGGATTPSHGGYTTRSPGGGTTPSHGGATTPSHGGHTTRSPGGGTTPSHGGATTPSHGGYTTRSPGGGTTPSHGGATTPSHGGYTTRSPGGGTTPSHGGATTPSHGGYTTRSPGGGTTPSHGGATTPSHGGYTTRSPGGGTTPSHGGATTPSHGGHTTRSPGGGTTPAHGGATTPSHGGYTTRSPGGGTTPSHGGYTTRSPGGGTTPSHGGYTTRSPGGGTTPSHGGATTPSHGGYTTRSPGGGTTPSHGGATTPSHGGYTTRSPGGGTTPSHGGATTPSHGGYTTRSPGGGTTPSHGGYTTRSPGGGTTPSHGGATTPSHGGYTTRSPGGGTTPSHGGATTPSHGGYTTRSPGGGTTPSHGGATTPSHGGYTTPSPGGGTTPSDGGDNGDDCGPIIGGAIEVIPGCIKLSTTKLIREIISIKIKVFADVINLCCKLTISLGGIIDLFITGLGSILTRIVAVIYKIACCVYGWGDKSICTKDWNSQFGVIGEASTANDLIDLYRVKHCKNDVLAIISKYNGGKDVFKQNDFISIICQKILVLVDVITIISSGDIANEHLSITFVQVISIFGCITNSYSKGSGTHIIQKVIPVCAPHFVRQGCPDIVKEKTKIITTVTVGDNAQIDWQRIESKHDSGDVTTDIKDAFIDVKGSKDQATLTQIFNIEIPRSFDGCLSFIIRVIQALGNIIDLFISGLGSLLVRCVGLIIHYTVAILGKARNSRSFVCQKAYFDSFGVTVTGSALADLVTGFKLDHCQKELQAIQSAQKGKENAVYTLMINVTSSLVAIVSKGSKIVEADLVEMIRLSLTIFGGFANSCQPNLGEKICKSVIPVCSSYLENNNLPALTVHTTTITKSIAVCNNVQVGWVATTTVVED